MHSPRWQQRRGGSALTILNYLANLNYLAVVLGSGRHISFPPKEMGNNYMLSLDLETFAVATTSSKDWWLLLCRSQTFVAVTTLSQSYSFPTGSWLSHMAFLDELPLSGLAHPDSTANC